MMNLVGFLESNWCASSIVDGSLATMVCPIHLFFLVYRKIFVLMAFNASGGRLILVLELGEVMEQKVDAHALELLRLCLIRMAGSVYGLNMIGLKVELYKYFIPYFDVDGGYGRSGGMDG